MSDKPRHSHDAVTMQDALRDLPNIAQSFVELLAAAQITLKKVALVGDFSVYDFDPLHDKQRDGESEEEFSFRQEGNIRRRDEAIRAKNAAMEMLAAAAQNVTGQQISRLDAITRIARRT